MNYLDVYYARLNHSGETTSERIKNGGIRSFERWMAESPFTVNSLSVERGLYFNGIIEENKDKEYKKIMFLHVALDIPVKVGDIMNWQVEDGSIEKWIILQEEKKVNPTYKTFWIIKCNYLIKWIDSGGHLQKSWSYVLSSTDDKVKGNFRTWHNLITPQPNKYAEIIMPRPVNAKSEVIYTIDRGTNFIIEDEGWKMVEADFTSVAGILYMSLTENKVNFQYDDLIEDIADTDKLAQYRIDTPDVMQTFKIGTEIKPTFTLMKNGLPITDEVILTSSDLKVAKNVNGVLTAVGAGETQIIISLKEFPSIQQTLTITVSDAEQEFSAYIEGADTIRLDRYSTYKLIGVGEIDTNVVFTLEGDYAEIHKTGPNECVIHANNKNRLGMITLTAAYKNMNYTKQIKVIPLW